MILANLTRAIREQNYYAVVLEFLIVIAGVVIGFQIQGWNQSREDAQVEEALLIRLQDDFSSIINDNQGVFDSTVEAPDHLRNLIVMIRNGQEPDDHEAVWRGISASITTFSMTPASTTFEEIKSSGNLSYITDPDLRSLLAAFEVGRASEVLVVQYFLDLSITSPVYSHVRMDLEQGLFNPDSRSYAGQYAWEDLMELESHFQAVLIWVESLAQWRTANRALAAEILEQIEGQLS